MAKKKVGVQNRKSKKSRERALSSLKATQTIHKTAALPEPGSKKAQLEAAKAKKQAVAEKRRRKKESKDARKEAVLEQNDAVALALQKKEAELARAQRLQAVAAAKAAREAKTS